MMRLAIFYVMMGFIGTQLFTAERDHRYYALNYALKQGIVVEKYIPSRHERGLKELLQRNLAIGSVPYIENLFALEIFSAYYNKFNLLVAYNNRKDLVVGFSWVAPSVIKKMTHPEIYVHPQYHSAHVAHLIADAAGTTARPPRATRRQYTKEQLLSKGPTAPPLSPTVFMRVVDYASPFCFMATSFAAFSTLQTMYYQQRYSSSEARKLALYIIAGCTLYAVRRKLQIISA